MAATSHIFLLLPLLLLSPPGIRGCFDQLPVIDPLSSWMQPLSLENRLYYSIAPMDHPDRMTVQSEINLPKYSHTTYTCLELYEDSRVLVQVEQDDRKTHYQCLQFKHVADHVVRQAKTRLRAHKKKVDCLKDIYITDDAVIMAYHMLSPQPCPLHGGFQMLFHQSFMTGGHCLDSVLSYNPNVRFQCDGNNVIVDFGQDCQPPILREFQKMRRRHISHLSCVASWSEKNNIKSVLLRMRDQPYDFWCMHYQEVNTSVELMSVFLTLDGRCVENAFHDEDVPKKTSLFGQLASYFPSDDHRCSHNEYLDECKYNKDNCFKTEECPASCQRCNRMPSKSMCSFMMDTLGHWQTFDSRLNMSVDINRNSLKVSKYGEFACRGEFEQDLPDRVYPVVQADDRSTCLPYYACALVFSPLPGILNFRLYPAWRDEETGKPFTCKQTHDKIGYVIPVDDERMITMMNSKKLAKGSCGFDTTFKYPTQMSQCLLEVGECGDKCDILIVKYDNDTCSEQSVLGFPIETDHVCYGKFRFSDGVKGMLTYSKFSDRYLCWIYGPSRLFITTPEGCNSYKVSEMFRDEEAYITYDPALALSKPMYATVEKGGQGGSGGKGNSATRCAGSILFSILLALLSLTKLSL